MSPNSTIDALVPSRSGGQRELRVRTLGPILFSLALAGTAASCCFGGTVPRSSAPQAPADPGIDALWLCTSIEDIRCVAHTPVLPSTTPTVFVSFRTHDVQRFVRPATLVIYAGMPRRELVRGPVPAAAASVAGAGQSVTWRFAEDITPPSAGWPVDGPVGVELLDANGVTVASTQVTFTGPRTPTRPVGAVAVCRTDQLAGSATNQYCPTTSAVVIRDPAQDVWATYSPGDAALFARGFVTVLEQQRGQRWVELASDRVEPMTLPADDIGTVRLRFSMAPSALVGVPLRVRFLSGDAEVGSATFTIQSP